MKSTDRAPESYNGLPMRLDTVDRFIFDGLQSRFFDVFNTPSVWVTATDKVKTLDKLFGERNEKVSYPYVFLKLNAWELAEDRMNLRAGTLRGTRVSISNDEKSTIEMRYLPVNFQVAVELTTNNFRDLLDFGRRWLLSSKKGALNFQVEYGQTRFDIRVMPDPNISFPQREADPENVQEYLAEMNLTIQGFISEAEPVEQAVIDTVGMSMSAQIDKETPDVFWSFNIPKRPV